MVPFRDQCGTIFPLPMVVFAMKLRALGLKKAKHWKDMNMIASRWRKSSPFRPWGLTIVNVVRKSSAKIWSIEPFYSEQNIVPFSKFCRRAGTIAMFCCVVSEQVDQYVEQAILSDGMKEGTEQKLGPGEKFHILLWLLHRWKALFGSLFADICRTEACNW